MSLMLVCVSIWLALIVAVLLWHGRTVLALWREPMLARPVVIVESDDWGPGPPTDAIVLRRIADLLRRTRDREGRRAVMTLGVVLGVPDGEAILVTDCRAYHRRTLEDPRYSAIVEAIRDGCDAGVFMVQRHGFEHFWPDVLLEQARRDEGIRAWLADRASRSESLPAPLQSRWVDTRVLPSRQLPEAKVVEAVSKEAEALRRVFGATPTVAVPNTFVWGEAVERAWAASGVRVVVTCGRQYGGRGADGKLSPPVGEIRNGERGAAGVTYVVRDAYFEPLRGHTAEQVWRAVDERSALGRPTLLETHRENFIAGPDAAEAALRELARALDGTFVRHRDVCFISTAELVAEMMKPDSWLVSRGGGARARVFVRRLRAASALSTGLKLSGLSVVLRLVERALAGALPAART